MLSVKAGMAAFGNSDTKIADLSVAVTTGALAGLFTDRVLQQLQGLLGATDPSKSASTQPIPGKTA
jgi:hypothetical protein